MTMTRKQSPLRPERHATGAFYFGRRAFLAGAGMTLPLPFLETLARPAHAAPRPGGPRRFILWHQPQGMVFREWATGAGGDTTDFRLGRILDPLAPYRDRMIFLRGVDNKVYTVSEGETGHGRIELTVCTGRPAMGGKPHGPSLDYELHGRLKGPEHRAPLHVGIGPGNWVSHFSPGPGQVIFSNHSPRRLVDSLVGKAPIGDGVAERAGRKRVLDAVRENFKSFRGRVAAADRERLDQHEARLGELDKLIGARSTCTPPSATAIAPGVDFTTLAPAQIEVAVFALSCNLTPVVTMDWTEQNHAGPPFTTFSKEYGHDWHDMIHRNAFAPGAVESYRFMSEQLARLLKRLAETPAGDGRTLLDDTLVLSVGDFGNFPHHHSATGVHAALAGSLGGGERMGRLLTFSDVEKDAPSKWALNNLYVSVLRAFGGDDVSYGQLGETRHGPVLPGAIPGILS